MDEITKIAVEDFEKKPDGSWMVSKNSDIITKAGNVIRLTPGIVLKKGRKLWELDVVEVLEKVSAK
ncbi:MAG TPA: hypothetical protein VHO84_10365 [Syntrophorhabdaceae bacterium]|nr:hypothetical protein [Syntrophorhabdaceae bacterium]